MIRIVNFIGFQVGWFATVFGAGNGMPWLGWVVVPLVLLVHLVQSGVLWKQQLRLALAVGGIGFVVDSVLVLTDVFAPVRFLGWGPIWMMMLWVNQAATLHSSLGWMRGRYLLGGFFGAIGGPLAYAGGAKLGAAMAAPTATGLVILAITWALVFPGLLFVSEAIAAAPRASKAPSRGW